MQVQMQVQVQVIEGQRSQFRAGRIDIDTENQRVVGVRDC